MDTEKARFNMIEQQIRPWNVLDPQIIDLLWVVKREQFVPESLRAQAFTDTEIPLLANGQPTGEVMLAPKVEARLLQDLQIGKHETVLEVGAGSGYMAALLGARAQKVLTLESHPELAKVAAAHLRAAGIDNVTVQHKDGSNATQAVSEARFDVIVLSGSVPFVPQGWLDRLNPGGRLAAIVGELPVMRGEIITRGHGSQAGEYTTVSPFDTVTRPLAGFPQKEHFHF